MGKLSKQRSAMYKRLAATANYISYRKHGKDHKEAIASLKLCGLPVYHIRKSDYCGGKSSRNL